MYRDSLNLAEFGELIDFLMGALVIESRKLKVILDSDTLSGIHSDLHTRLDHLINWDLEI